jgi:hypothetical protein
VSSSSFLWIGAVGLVISAACAPRAVRESDLAIVERRPSAAATDDPRGDEVARAYAEMNERQNQSETPVTDLLFGESDLTNDATSPASPTPDEPPDVPPERVARCKAFWWHLAEYKPHIIPAPNKMISTCDVVYRSDELCILRAKSVADVDRCSERISPAECEQLAVAIATRYGTERFPAPRQKELVTRCTGGLQRALYECLLAPDESFNGCQETIVEKQP